MPTYDSYGNYLDDQGGIMIPAQAFGGASGNPADLAGRLVPGDEAPRPYSPQVVSPGAAPPHAPFGLASPTALPGAAPAPAASPPPALPGSGIDAISSADPATSKEDQDALTAQDNQAAIESDPSFRMVGEPDRRRVPQIDQWYDLEQKKNAKAREYTAEIRQHEQANLADKAQADQELAAWGQDSRAKLAKSMDDYAKARIDPLRTFHDASTWQQLAFVAGMAMGALANPKTGKNPALEIAFHLIDKDVEAQRANIDVMGDSVKNKQSLYAINLAAWQNENVAKAVTKAQQLETLRQKLATDFEQSFAAPDLAINYTKMMDEIEKEQAALTKKAAAENLEDSAKLAGIDETLARTSKLRAETKKLLAKLQGGTGGPVASAAQPAATAADLVKELYTDKSGKGPSTFGSDNVTTHFRELRAGGGGQEIGDPIHGLAFVDDDATRDAFAVKASAADKMISSYLALEAGSLGRKTPWDDEAIKKKQLAAALFIANMQSLKGTGGISDKEGERLEGLIADLTEPNNWKSLKGEETRRQAFANARGILTSGTLRDYVSLRHVKMRKDGQPVEVSVEWAPRGLTATLPAEAGDSQVELTGKTARRALKDGSIDTVTRVAQQEGDRVAGRPIPTDDRDALEAQLRQVNSTLASVKKARAGLGRDGMKASGPTPAEGGATADEIRAQMRKPKLSDREYRKLQDQLLEAERGAKTRGEARDPARRKDLDGSIRSLERRSEELAKALKDLDAKGAAARRFEAGPQPRDRIGTR